MSAPHFRVTVVTEEGKQYEHEAVAVTAPGTQGYLGILANHAPLLTTLVPGKFVVRTPSEQTTQFDIGGGMLEVYQNQVTVLTDRWVTHA